MKGKEKEPNGVKKQTIVVQSVIGRRNHPDDEDSLLITSTRGRTYQVDQSIACCLENVAPGARLELAVMQQVIGAKVLNPKKSP